MAAAPGRLLVGMIVTMIAVQSPARAAIPADPERTLEHVQGGRLRVGIVENPPWVVRSDGAPAGIEGELVQQLAKELGATPEWHWGGEQAHMEALQRFELDLVIGGITKQTPWKKTVGMTDTYFDKHVIATAPGENAWIKRLDEFLSRRRAEIARAAQERNAR
ncbi:MAG: transporter substrate-binding domain-containing protein [Chthoniobacterales bacterium]